MTQLLTLNYREIQALFKKLKLEKKIPDTSKGNQSGDQLVKEIQAVYDCAIEYERKTPQAGYKKKKKKKGGGRRKTKRQSSVLYTNKFFDKANDVYRAKESISTYKLNNNNLDEKIGYIAVKLLPSYYDYIVAANKSKATA